MKKEKTKTKEAKPKKQPNKVKTFGTTPPPKSPKNPPLPI